MSMEARREPFTPDPLLGALIGLCPVVAASDSLADGVILGLGAALSALVLGLSLPSLKSLMPARLRSPMAFALAAGLAALYGLAAEAYSPLLAKGLGIYLPLVAVNCLVLASLRRGLRPGEDSALGLAATVFLYFLVSVLVAGLREVLGAGSLTLPTPGLSPRSLVILESPPLRLLVAPAGGFMVLGCLAAAYRLVQRVRGRRLP